MGGLVVKESVIGMWFYHLARAGEKGSLCGANCFEDRPLPFTLWGHRSHVNERYCPKCHATLEQIGQPPARQA